MTEEIVSQPLFDKICKAITPQIVADSTVKTWFLYWTEIGFSVSHAPDGAGHFLGVYIGKFKDAGNECVKRAYALWSNYGV